MPRQSSTLVRSATPALFKVLASTTVLLLFISAATWGQESGFQTSAASVDQAFSTFHQTLSATVIDLLTSTQRPLVVERPSSNSTVSSDAEFGLDVQREDGQTVRNVRPRQAVERVQALRPLLEPILREEGIPQQMAAVILVESGGQSAALSPKGARGLWQFMPDTARRYGLVVTAAVDERLDPYKSTRAAARYLRDLYSQFGNWPLALAAYNAGEDTVQRAVERTSKQDFASIAGILSIETQNYVPAVLRAAGILGTRQVRYSMTSADNHAMGSDVYAVAKLEN